MIRIYQLTLRVGSSKSLQNQAGELLKKSNVQQPLTLVHSTAEYCDPAFFQRASHQRHITQHRNRLLAPHS